MRFCVATCGLLLSLLHGSTARPEEGGPKQRGLAANYCGPTWSDAATNCGQTCPGGVDSECPPGESCFGGITGCAGNPPTSGNYCGSDWTMATECAQACPNGVDSDCPQGQTCFGGVTECGTSTSGNYCGSDWTMATECAQACPNGVDSDCPQGLTCFGGVNCGGGGHTPEQNECGLGIECPLLACCSVFGYCGWTEDFCNAECQSDCDTVTTPPGGCDDSNKMTVKWGYYASWAADRECDAVTPASINPVSYTHLAYSFAIVDEMSSLVPSDPSKDPARYLEFNALKVQYPGLRTAIAVGGWAFNDPPTQFRFSNMVATQQSRAIFITSALSFLRQYGFDGLDLDWEYPGAPDRGGSPEDFLNYVLLCQELRAAFDAVPERFELTMAVPLSNWYLQHFDLPSLAAALDFFNVMSYDLHGVWDANIPSLGPFVHSHTDLFKIEAGLQMFYKSGIPGNKLVLGLAAYGRTYTLQDPTCTNPGCTFVGAGTAGSCTQAEGFMSFLEIERLGLEGRLDLNYEDPESASMVLVADDNQWISHDNTATWGHKIELASDLCFRGTMVWSIDMMYGGSAPVGGDGGGNPGPTNPSPELDEIEGDFCWRDTYGRGVGTIPDSCPADRERLGEFCYKRCPPGYHRSLLDCRQNCPVGWRDDGAFCRLAEYTRGGYLRRFGEFNNNGIFARCETDHGEGNCEGWGLVTLVAYPKCKPGYSTFGCCICRPATPDCGALGFAGQFDLSCTKTTILTSSDPTLQACAPGLAWDAGLCYKQCDDGYHGVGPVCWGGNPPGWVTCGMGSASDSNQCSKAVFDQLISVGELAFNIATLGSSGAATVTKGTSQWNGIVSKVKDIQSKLPSILAKHPNLKEGIEAAFKLNSLAGAGSSLDSFDPEAVDDPTVLVRFFASLAAVIDPTGVSGVIAAYTFPKCSVLIANAQ